MKPTKKSPAPAMSTATNTPEEIRAEMKRRIDEAARGSVRSGKATPEDAQAAARAQIAELQAEIVEHQRASRVGVVAGSAEGTGKDAFSIARVTDSLLARTHGSSDWRERAAAEWEMSDQAMDEMRAQGTSPDTSGGFIVPGQVMDSEFIPALRNHVVALELGANVFPASTTPLEIPREDTPVATAEGVAENQASAETEMKLAMMRLEPHTCQSFIKASRRFMQMGTNADSRIRDIITKAVGQEWNRWVLKGLGSANEPLGLLNATGVNSVDFSSVTATAGGVEPLFYAKLLEMQGLAEEANAFDPSMAWAISPRFARAARMIKSENAAAGTASLEMMRNVVTSGENPNLIDHRFAKTNFLGNANPCEALIGPWASVFLPMWGGLVIEASNVSGDALQKRQTHIVAYLDIDVGIEHTVAFSKATGFNASSL